MNTGIRLIAQCYDTSTGKIIEEVTLQEDRLSKAQTLNELGYLHVEQINFLQKMQDFKIKHQIVLNTVNTCPVCHEATKKKGLFPSNFHAALTDHRVVVQRTYCNCGWMSPTSIDGIFGSSIHPDLLKKQALQGSKESYEKSSLALDAESANKRPINSHSQIYKTVKRVGELIEEIRRSDSYVENAVAAHTLIANIDGGHIKARGDTRSFEAMVATVHNPENLTYANKNHNTITSKTTVGSAKNDHQETMKALFKNACKAQGMTKDTDVVCLADGADNCWSIAQSIEQDCRKVTFILDWFHIGMKFKNISISEEFIELYEKIKWHLWHGNPDMALIKLEQLQDTIKDATTIEKLKKLAVYIRNNRENIVNYESREQKGEVYTSNLAESTVNTLINERQKGKKKMLWSREGAHNVIQIRASTQSDSWDEDWKKVEDKFYRKAA